MRQFQFSYDNEDKFVNGLRKIKQWCQSSVTSTVFFQVYIHTLNRPKVETVCAMIEKELPEAIYMGCSTNGNILMGDYCPSEIIVICTVFEYFTTKIKLLQFGVSTENAKEVTDSLIKEVEDNPWCKCVMCFSTIRGISTSDICVHLKKLPEKVQFFGGGAMNNDMNSEYAFVFSSVGKISDHASVFALIGGEDFNVASTYITGWKPLGRELNVTKATGPILYELDGKPAYETYYKYLNIKNDEHFFNNTLEFPFFYEHNGINILRAPTASRDDGSLVMTADMEEHVRARIAYGDPWTILENVDEEALKLKSFIPECIFVFSCAARKAFWGEEEVGKETLPFQSLAPTSGFYTSGEFLRTNGHVNQHNVTLVVAAMREGKRDVENMPDVETNSAYFTGKVSMINRLATFIQAATEELEEANEQLRIMAIMDGLTQVYNRREIQRRIIETVDKINADLEETGSANTGDEAVKTGVSLIMIDIDDFKKVNDTYGHKEGDCVLQQLAKVMTEIIPKSVPDCAIGRWGGEEFMILLPNTDEKKATALAEFLRVSFAVVDFPEAPPQTISLGVAEMNAHEDPDTFCMRVDEALYTGKRNGKNQVVIR